MLTLTLFITFILTATAQARRLVVSPQVMAFWTRVAQCETGGRWDWGAQHRRGEGHTYEGGVGFYWQTWRAWASELHLLTRYPHAYMAPRDYQAKVAQYGLTVHRGYWGCLH